MEKNHVLSLISKVKKSADAMIEERLRSQGINDLLLPHGSILSVMFRTMRPMNVTEIAGMVKRNKSSVTELVNRLENNGYVTKTQCNEDMRVVYVSLTEKALSIEIVFKEISKDVLNVFYNGFTEEEKQQFVAMCDRVITNFNDK